MSSLPPAGPVAVVTGASRGIGRALAVHLARQGVPTAGIARPGPDLRSLRHAAGGAVNILPVPDDDLSALTEACRADPDHRRLRLNLG